MKVLLTLCKSHFNRDDLLAFSVYLDNIQSISEEERSFCDSPVTLEEILNAFNQLKNIKSPGNDGITSEFYKLFPGFIGSFLLEVFSEALTRTSSPASLTQGVICLIPKPGTHLLSIDNWRPITLLNNDSKLFALVFTKGF